MRRITHHLLVIARGTRQLRKGRHSETGRIYLVTSVTADRRPVFIDLRCGRLLVREMMFEASLGDLDSLAFVVMPDHLHWLVQLRSSANLSQCVQRTKSRSARTLNAWLGSAGRFWQPGFHDHALRKDEDLVNIARYVVANPLRAGLVGSVRDYPLWDAVWV